MSYYIVHPEANFGPLAVPDLPDSPDNYGHLFNSPSHDPLAEVKPTIARTIDTHLDGMTISTLYSLRRLYKIYGVHPDSYAIHREMQQVHGENSVTHDEILTSLTLRDEVITQLLPIAYRWVSWCYQNRENLNLYNLTLEDMTEIAEDTVTKIVNYRYIFSHPDSNGVGLIKLVSASIKPMLIFTNFRSGNPETVASDFNGFDDDTSVLDWLNSANDQIYNPENLCCATEDGIPEPSKIYQIDEVSTQDTFVPPLKLFQQLMFNGQIPLETLFTTISSLPLIYQSALLHYFGYVEPRLTLDQFIHKYPPITTLMRSTGLRHLTSMLQKSPPDYSNFDLASMISRSTNISQLTTSLQEERRRYSTLFALLGDLHSIPQAKLDQLGDNEQWLLNIVINHITYDSSGTPSRNLHGIAQALSSQFSAPVKNLDVAHLIKNVLLPALHDQSFEHSWLEYFSQLLLNRMTTDSVDLLTQYPSAMLRSLLSQVQYEAYILVYQNNMNLSQAANQLGVSRQAISLRLMNAQNRLSRTIY